MHLFALSSVNAARSKLAFGHGVNDWIPEQWSNAVAGEVGEMCNKIKKHFSRGDNSVSLGEIAEEAADAVIYLDLLIQCMGMNLEGAIIEKFNRVSREKNVPIFLQE